MGSNINEIKSIIQIFFGSEMVSEMEKRALSFEKENMTPEEIAENIKVFPFMVRQSIFIITSTNGNKEIADKIGVANQIINERMVSDFKNSVANGSFEDFLCSMHWADKIALKSLMGLESYAISKRKTLTNEELRYLDLINRYLSEDKDFKDYINQFNNNYSEKAKR